VLPRIPLKTGLSLSDQPMTCRECASSTTARYMNSVSRRIGDIGDPGLVGARKLHVAGQVRIHRTVMVRIGPRDTATRHASDARQLGSGRSDQSLLRLWADRARLSRTEGSNQIERHAAAPRHFSNFRGPFVALRSTAVSIRW
jgi:hypothetical protein